MLAMPAFSLAQIEDTDIPDIGGGLVPCGHTDLAGKINNPCSFGDFLTLINGGIIFILKFLVVPIAAVMFFYAGFLMVTSGGSTEARGRAKNIFTNAALGLVIAAGAWLIIKTILSILSPATGGVSPWAWIGF